MQAIAGENLVPALARKDHLEFLAGGLGKQGRGQIGVIAHRKPSAAQMERGRLWRISRAWAGSPDGGYRSAAPSAGPGAKLIRDRGPGKPTEKVRMGSSACRLSAAEHGGIHPTGGRGQGISARMCWVMTRSIRSSKRAAASTQADIQGRDLPGTSNAGGAPPGRARSTGPRRVERLDPLEEGPGPGGELVLQVGGQAGGSMGGCSSRRAARPLISEAARAAGLRGEEKGLDARRSRQDQAVPGRRTGEGEHAQDMGQKALAIFPIGVEDDLGVGMGAKAVPPGLGSARRLDEVVDLAVGDRGRPVEHPPFAAVDAPRTGR